MPAAVEPKGLKRICMGCGTRFYDFNKRPIVCPSCKAEFLIEVKTKTRRGRAANDEAVKVAPAPVAKEADDEEVAENSDTVSLDEVEEDESGDDDMDDAGLEIDDDMDDDLDDDDDMDDEEEVEVDVEEK